MADPILSEQDFLLAELRYSIGQIRIQYDRVPEGERPSAARLLEDLMSEEERYQRRYAHLSHRPVEPALDRSHGFEASRERTLRALEAIDEPWTAALRDLVRQQVSGDRSCATRLASLRRSND